MIDFPNSPTNGQVFTSVNTSWTYDGSKWVAGNNPAAFLPLTGGTLTGGLNINMATATGAILRLHNSTTGTTATDGLEVSVSNAGLGYLWNYENAALSFGTNNVERMNIAADGLVTVSGQLNITPASGSSQIVLTKPSSGVAAAIYSFTGANWQIGRAHV